MSASLPVTGSFAAADLPFFGLVQSDLRSVEERLVHEVRSEVAHVHAVGRHVLQAGGKRLRPAVVALAARAAGGQVDSERVAAIGCAIELVHMATLVHDDVVDRTEMRRGRRTANAVYGNDVAVIAGDYLLARAMRLLSDDSDNRILHAVSSVTLDMSEGEVMEIQCTGDPMIGEDLYYEIARKKTAVFVEGCCRCGAILANAPEAVEDALADYGRNLGVAFQIADDLLDYAGNTEVTGKPVGGDLREGRATLPFLYALRVADVPARERLLAAFGDVRQDDESVCGIVELLVELGALGEARCAAEQHADEALAALSSLPETEARCALGKLADFVVQRDR